MSHSTVAPASLPPHVQIIQMGTAYWVSQFVCTAANMRLADHLADGPRSASELAAMTGANPRAMHRFMRTLASLGMLAQDERRPLRPHTARGCAEERCAGSGARDRPLDGRTRHSAAPSPSSSIRSRPGRPRWRRSAACRCSTTWRSIREEAAQFSEAMVGIHGAEPPAVAAAYDFSRFGTIVDVGGATGNMLAPHPQAARAAARRPLRSAARRHATRRRCCARTEWKIGSRSSRATSSRPCPREVTPTSCRTSFTTGTRISA